MYLENCIHVNLGDYRKCTSWIYNPLGRDCVAYTNQFKSPYGSQLPTAFQTDLCTYFSNTNILDTNAKLKDTKVCFNHAMIGRHR